VGDWAIATYWGTGVQPKPRVPSGEAGQWGARVGWVVPSLWQLDVCQRYGYAVPDFAGPSQVLGVVPAYGQIIEAGAGPLLPGFNYVLTQPTRPPGEPGAGRAEPSLDEPGRHLLEKGADLLGSGECAVLDAGSRAVLCLRRPVRLTSANPSWQLERELGIPDVIEALALAMPAATSRWFVVGLWTPEFGYLHTGELCLRIEAGRYRRGHAFVELTGVYNDVAGRYMGWLHHQPARLEFSPVPAPGNRWPLSC
jgi:hypothetical protein